jgi:hypothetical protein
MKDCQKSGTASRGPLRLYEVGALVNIELGGTDTPQFGVIRERCLKLCRWPLWESAAGPSGWDSIDADWPSTLRTRSAILVRVYAEPFPWRL